MAKVVVGAEVEVKTGSAAKSVGDLRKQLKDAQKDVARLSDEFGVTSAEAINAAKKAAQLRDTIQDSKELIDAFNPATKFQAFSGAINTVVGGFTALTGAQALFGEKSEQVEKVLLKVQSALALSQGVSQILDAGGAFNTLAAVIKSKVVAAFGTLRAAIISTGIGALVVGVGLLIANFDKVKQALLNAIPGLSTFFDFVGKVTDKGANVTFPTYGVEGFAHYKQLTKENGAPAKQDETLPFKVTEFSKDNKRIVVSHVRTYDDKRREEKAGKEKAEGRERDETSKAVKKIKDTQEKSTLGDLDVLSALKDSMESKEKKANTSSDSTDTNS